MKKGDKVLVGREKGKIKDVIKTTVIVVEIDGEERLFADGLNGWAGFIEERHISKIAPSKPTKKTITKKKPTTKRK